MSKTRKRTLNPAIDWDAPFAKGELKAWRVGLGWTQEEAAGALGLNARTYQNWEQGHRKMPFPRILRAQIERINVVRKRALRPSQAKASDLFD